MNAKQKYMQPPSIAERPAVFSSFEDATRWNTSCCGIEPSIIVTHAATKPRMPASVNWGTNVENLPASIAWLTTCPTPPASWLTPQPMYSIPMTMMIIWMKSVMATAHTPPQIVYTSTVDAPTTIPTCCDIHPSDTTLKTRPSAEICAATQ